MRKRHADEWDPEPRVRAMYDDQALRVASEVPGPGTYSLSARRALKLDTGVSFGAAEFGSPQAMAYDAHTSTTEKWALKRGAEEPGPMTYDVVQDEMRRSLILQGKGRGGTQFAPRSPLPWVGVSALCTSVLGLLKHEQLMRAHAIHTVRIGVEGHAGASCRAVHAIHERTDLTHLRVGDQRG